MAAGRQLQLEPALGVGLGSGQPSTDSPTAGTGSRVPRASTSPATRTRATGVGATTAVVVAAGTLASLAAPASAARSEPS